MSFTPIESIAASRGGAYRFLDDNRDKLLIPLERRPGGQRGRVRKQARPRRPIRCPSRSSCNIIWREELLLDGKRFGRFAGERTAMLCGATMVLDQNGNQIHWSRKPGSVSVGDRERTKSRSKQEGIRRRKELLDTIAARVAAG